MDSDIDIRVEHSLLRTLAYGRVERSIREAAERMGANDYRQWSESLEPSVLTFSYRVRGFFVQGIADVDDDAVRVQIDLPRIVERFSGIIAKQIEEGLREALAVDAQGAPE